MGKTKTKTVVLKPALNVGFDSPTLSAIGGTNSISRNGHGHGGHGHGGGYALVSGEDTCCPPVTDPLTLLTVLGAIAAITVALRQVVISNITGRRKRRSAGIDTFDQWVQVGKNLYKSQEGV